MSGALDRGEPHDRVCRAPVPITTASGATITGHRPVGELARALRRIQRTALPIKHDPGRCNQRVLNRRAGLGKHGQDEVSQPQRERQPDQERNGKGCEREGDALPGRMLPRGNTSAAPIKDGLMLSGSAIATTATAKLNTILAAASRRVAVGARLLVTGRH